MRAMGRQQSGIGVVLRNGAPAGLESFVELVHGVHVFGVERSPQQRLDDILQFRCQLTFSGRNPNRTPLPPTSIGVQCRTASRLRQKFASRVRDDPCLRRIVPTRRTRSDRMRKPLRYRPIRSPCPPVLRPISSSSLYRRAQKPMRIGQQRAPATTRSECQTLAECRRAAHRGRAPSLSMAISCASSKIARPAVADSRRGPPGLGSLPTKARLP